MDVVFDLSVEALVSSLAGNIAGDVTFLPLVKTADTSYFPPLASH